jgi:amidase
MLTNELCVSRTVRDTAGVLDALQGVYPGDTTVAPAPARPYRDEARADPGSLRIAMLAENPLGTGEVHPDCVAATEDVAKLLEELGHTVERTYPKALADPALLGAFTTLWDCELLYNFAYWEKRIGRSITAGDVEPLTWALAEQARGMTGAEYIEAEHACHDLGTAVAEWMAGGYDLILTPTLGEPPVPLGTFSTPEEPILGLVRAATFVPFTPVANMTGQPAISLPLSWNADNLPIGAHFIAPWGREDVLLRLAGQLEQARPWADRVPPIHA